LIDERFRHDRKDHEALAVPRVQCPPAAAAAARSQLAKRWSSTDGALMGERQPVTERPQLLDSVLDRDLIAYVELAGLDDGILTERDDVGQKPPSGRLDTYSKDVITTDPKGRLVVLRRQQWRP
jgi:hypothetical protein